MYILAEYKGAKRKVYLLKPLTMLLIVAIGLSMLPEKLDWYHYALLICLLFSIGGDVALMWPSDKFMLGLVSFLTGHTFYISGLISGIELSLSWYVWVPLIILGSGMFLVLRSGLGKMELPVLLYILVILSMNGVAWESQFQLELSQTYFAVWGATFSCYLTHSWPGIDLG